MIPFFGKSGQAEKQRAAEARLRLIRDYWESLRGDRLLPSRSEINPRGIEAALGQAMLIERVGRGVARFRVAGMDITDLAGMDVRGMPISCLMMPGERLAFADALEEVFARPARLWLDLEAERGLGRPPVTARMLLLPLAMEPGGAAMAFGALCRCGSIGQAPRRFALARRLVEPLTPEPGLPAAPRVVAFAEPPAAPYDPRPRPPRAAPGRTHLRLVKTE